MSLICENLSYCPSGALLPILKNITLDINVGEMVALVGPNGAGKSSLLRILAGLTRRVNGSVSLNGRSISNYQTLELATVRAWLAQTHTLDFNFSAIKTVQLGRGPWQPESAVTSHKVAFKNLQVCDAAHLAERFYPELSGGEQQRVQLARIFTQVKQTISNGWLLLDEPCNALDPAHQFEILKHLKLLCSQGAGVVCSMHDLPLAAAYFDRIIVIQNGEIITDNSPDLALSKNTILKVFGVSGHWKYGALTLAASKPKSPEHGG
ncbi:MAG: ATP-binding cassette domain-containing protein [Proteobacteria bacterium]|jgi:iron complex transport system ATP-binding protein|nr:ATP-binding cassette domain-containing protein [Pseudomonadota bacterium]